MRRENNSTSYIILSILVHGLLTFAVVTYSPQLEMLPEGTVGTEIEFTALEPPPQGQQLKTIDVGDK